MRNTKKFVIARILIIPQKNKFEAVCLDFDLIEEARTLREAKKLIEAAVRGYVVNICKNGLDDSLLNRPAAKKYWKMFEQYQRLSSDRCKPLAGASKRIKNTIFLAMPIEMFAPNICSL